MMADEDQDMPESSRSADPQNLDDRTDASAFGADFLPIEGESKWVMLMRVLAGATLCSILVIGAVFHFLTGDDSFAESQQMAMMLGGIVFVLILEYFIFFLIVIPRQANYGRYVIHETKVDYYPLKSLGLGVSSQSRSVAIGRFMGVATGRMADKQGNVSFAVYLVHSEDKGKTINVRHFATIEEAEKFAHKLGNHLRLNVVSQARKPVKRRAL